MIPKTLVFGAVAPVASFIIFIIATGVICIHMRKRTVGKPNSIKTLQPTLCSKNDRAHSNAVRDSESKVTKEIGSSYNTFVDQTQEFHLAEIKKATRNFINKVGEGSFGPVFYGKLSNGQEIAVKVLDINSTQGSNEFFNEVTFLSRAHHKNVVCLLGYYSSVNQRMLVYEYLSGGTLESYLHDSEKASLLTWKARLKIALDGAKGLEYLHGDCNPTIIHRDVKSSNILLTEKLVAKVADFGLSKLGPEEGISHVSTLVKGTSGYVDPEYYETQKLTQKSDVYSFGVVLLELLTGQQPIFSDPHRTYVKLCDWARERLIAGNLKDIIDPRLGQSYNIDAFWKVADIAMYSVEPRSIHRPDMCEVVQELKEALAIECGAHRTVFANMVIQSTPWDDTEPM